MQARNVVQKRKYGYTVIHVRLLITYDGILYVKKHNMANLEGVSNSGVTVTLLPDGAWGSFGINIGCKTNRLNTPNVVIMLCF